MEFEIYQGVLKRYSGTKARVRVPEEVHTVADWAFFGCSCLQSLTLPDTVKKIVNYAFYQCKNIKEIRLPAQIEQVGDGLFSGCSCLLALSIPEGVKKIGTPFFKGCVSLETLKVPAGTDRIVPGAFSDLRSLNRLSCRMRLLHGHPEEVRQIAALTYLADPPEAKDRLMEYYVDQNREVLSETAVKFGDVEALNALWTQVRPDRQELLSRIDESRNRNQLEMTAMLMEYSQYGVSSRPGRAQDILRKIEEDDLLL